MYQLTAGSNHYPNAYSKTFLDMLMVFGMWKMSAFYRISKSIVVLTATSHFLHAEQDELLTDWNL